MKSFHATGVSSGIAIGQIHVLRRDACVSDHKAQGPDVEQKRFEEAKETALNRLSSLHEKAVRELGEETAAIFEIHTMMLQDEDFTQAIIDGICEQKLSAEQAVTAAADTFSVMFASMEDEYMQARAADVKDIAESLLRCLAQDAQEAHSARPVILLADDLSPSDTMRMDKNSLLAFVMVHGSAQSHVCIIAETMNIPTLIGTELSLQEDWEGKAAIVDGNSGTLIVQPDDETLAQYRYRQEQESENRRRIRELAGQESVTLDGQKVTLCANIGSLADLGRAIENDAEGIGLFRSEFIYLESSDYPTEEYQFQIYKQVLEGMPDKRVIIRTLDIGADKQAEYFHLEKEENPAMGLRAIRLCLTRPELFKTQLRALYRASAFGRLAILYPMITSVDELHRIREISSCVKAELTAEGIPYKDAEEGVMIETPAAALISDALAKEVDFFSVGTNDLSQYTLAIDRQNRNLESFFCRYHTAILRLIEMAARNAHQNGIWIGICGELAGDASLTETFLRMGIDELSMTPTKILPIRDKVRHTQLGER